MTGGFPDCFIFRIVLVLTSDPTGRSLRMKGPDPRGRIGEVTSRVAESSPRTRKECGVMLFSCYRMNIFLPYKLRHHIFLNILRENFFFAESCAPSTASEGPRGQKLFGVPNFFHRNLDGIRSFSSLYCHFSGCHASIFSAEPDGFSLFFLCFHRSRHLADEQQDAEMPSLCSHL